MVSGSKDIQTTRPLSRSPGDLLGRRVQTIYSSKYCEKSLLVSNFGNLETDSMRVYIYIYTVQGPPINGYQCKWELRMHFQNMSSTKYMMSYWHRISEIVMLQTCVIESDDLWFVLNSTTTSPASKVTVTCHVLA